MQTISADLTASLAKKNPKYYKKIELYRNLWNGSSFEFGAAEDITDELVDTSNSFWNLDNEGFGIWRIDNISITLRNDRNQWKQGNTIGHWTGLYLLNQSKITISEGAELADGTFETLKTFTGYISGDPVFHPEVKTVTLTLNSAMSIFEKFSGNDISTQITDEVLGSDSGSVFTTAENGVGIIDTVKRGLTLAGARTLKPDVDYAITTMKQKGIPATITLTTGTDLTQDENLYTSYKQLYSDKPIEWVVEEIMTLCGITSYDISTAVFASDIENAFIQNIKAHWDSGAEITNINTYFNENSMRLGTEFDDFNNGNYTAPKLWTVTDITAGGTIEVVSEQLKITSTAAAEGNCIRATSETAYGAWEVNMWGTGGFSFATFWIVGQTEIGGYATEGYFIRATSTGTIRLYKQTAVGSITMLIESNTTAHSNTKITVTRASNGDFEMFINGTSAGTANDNTYTTTAYIYFESTPSGAVTSYQYLDSVIISNSSSVITGEWISATQDLGADVTEFGVADLIYTENNGTVTFKTYTSDSSDFSTGNDPAGWVDVSGTTVMSAIKRYLKVKINLTTTDYFMPVSPVFDAFSIIYYTTTTVIALVDLTDKTCYQALDELVQWPAFEMGMSTAAKFFFRARNSIASLLDIRSNTNLIRIDKFDNGVERIKNKVVANFGDYQKISDASGDAHPNSIDSYGTREYAVPSTSLLPNVNVNIAFAIAPTILAYTKLPRRRVRAVCQFLPQMELGDKITLYYREDTAMRQWSWGDMDVYYGQANIEYHTEADLLARLNYWGVEMRVEGIENDDKKWQTILNLVEVI